MKKQRNAPQSGNWLKLDNAAKIYPSSMSRRWNAMFRLSATLTEPIDPDVLTQALDSTIRRLPSFALRLRKGLFWYYLEHIEGAPPVEPDVINPCAHIRIHEGTFMFRVRYHENRIATEFFHILADGGGGIVFLNTLVAEYLRIKYGAEIPRSVQILDCSKAPKPEEWEDSFDVYARPETISRAESKAYSIPGTIEERDFMHITTGIVSADAVYARAKTYGATVTEYLLTALVMAIYEIQKSEIHHRVRLPVKVCMPVNLRRFYPSVSVRNFSSFINPGIEPRLGVYTFEETLQRVKHIIGLEASEKMINARMSRNVADERNLLLRVIPLFIKNPALKFMHWKSGDRVSSSTLSNLGIIQFPPEMAQYIDRFDCMLGSLLYNPVACACNTYNGKLYVTFSRYIKESTVERNFFTFLVKEGLHVLLESNQSY